MPIKEYSILYNCPHTDVRRMWLPKAIEEEGEDLIGKSGKPHPEYWLDVCVGMGLDREFVQAIPSRSTASNSPSTASPTRRFKTSWLLGVAVSEGDDTAKAMSRDLDTFRKHYQWVPDDALTFYKLHADVDVEHGLIRKEILEKIRRHQRTPRSLHQRPTHEKQHAPGDGRLHLHGLRGPR